MEQRNGRCAGVPAEQRGDGIRSQGPVHALQEEDLLGPPDCRICLPGEQTALRRYGRCVSRRPCGRLPLSPLTRRDFLLLFVLSVGEQLAGREVRELRGWRGPGLFLGLEELQNSEDHQGAPGRLHRCHVAPDVHVARVHVRMGRRHQDVGLTLRAGCSCMTLQPVYRMLHFCAFLGHPWARRSCRAAPRGSVGVSSRARCTVEGCGHDDAPDGGIL